MKTLKTAVNNSKVRFFPLFFFLHFFHNQNNLTDICLTKCFDDLLLKQKEIILITITQFLQFLQEKQTEEN